MAGGGEATGDQMKTWSCRPQRGILPAASEGWGLVLLHQCPGLACKELISRERREPGREPAPQEESSVSSGIWGWGGRPWC